MRIKANIELDAGDKSFGTGLLPELISALRRCRSGDLLAIVGSNPELGPGLETWCRFTRNTLVDSSAESGRMRWLIRCGEAPADADNVRPVGSRLWLYTNFDCNLHCDYCCVRSSPKAARRELGLARVQRIASEAAELDVKEIFLTGGEPFLLKDIGDILDSPTPERHDQHRGKGTWMSAWKGIQSAREEGFRVRLAATVSTDEEADECRRFLDSHQIGEEDRVIRRIALRGFASDGVALARADLVPEVTITAEGVYWHPVGAADPDLLVTPDIFPLAEAFAAVRRAFDRESEHRNRLATIFNCA
jgi:TusA-related sulfurtransferase